MINLFIKALSIISNIILALIAIVGSLFTASLMISVVFHFLFTTNIGKIFTILIVIFLVISIIVELVNLGEGLKNNLIRQFNKKGKR